MFWILFVFIARLRGARAISSTISMPLCMQCVCCFMLLCMQCVLPCCRVLCWMIDVILLQVTRSKSIWDLGFNVFLWEPTRYCSRCNLSHQACRTKFCFESVSHSPLSECCFCLILPPLWVSALFQCYVRRIFFALQSISQSRFNVSKARRNVFRVIRPSFCNHSIYFGVIQLPLRCHFAIEVACLRSGPGRVCCNRSETVWFCSSVFAPSHPHFFRFGEDRGSFLSVWVWYSRWCCQAIHGLLVTCCGIGAFALGHCQLSLKKEE